MAYCHILPSCLFSFSQIVIISSDDKIPNAACGIGNIAITVKRLGQHWFIQKFIFKDGFS
jgi:hypothetical protein